MRLLIVDDSNVIRTAIARSAASKGYAPEEGLPGLRIVGLARDGMEALALARQTTPDVITLDITMPGMDGLDCLDELMRIVPRARVLMVSALTDKATTLTALKRGARGFLYKPFTEDELMAALKDAIS